MKNVVYIVVIVLCLAAAAWIAYKYIFSGGGSGGIEDISDTEMTWVKCNNPKCKAGYEMGLKAYYKEVRDRLEPVGMTTPALTCEKCGEASVYQGVKCANPDCGIVFIRGIVPGDFADRCPDCGQSETQEIRKRRMAGG